ncbi:MAG: TIGR03809 family protein [Xanthobacteraceae bacterium]|nr:TIGR03809 family protein [Xanthobacteraceae bacterium]
MAEPFDVDRGRAIIERWRVLAEKRLDYLIELLETGRWQRFHTKTDFLENLEEAKTAVETWRMLASREATVDNRPVDLSWLGRGAVPLAQRDGVSKTQPAATTVRARLSPSPSPAAPSPCRVDGPPPLVPSADGDWPRSADVATMQERYPLLRVTL